ncbi:MAG: ABC transporter ATP-binding protein [Gammaproteobacteria bacterium]|nr:ABC transporter ATP-binding protein [Gammaproteobacteria bacterium]
MTITSADIASANIEIENLHLSFGNTKVLEGVNLNIPSGEFFAFLGPSGSGKSTLLRSIAGFGPVPQGSIRIGGKDVVKLPPWKRDVGMVFQSYALWPHMSVAKNVGFGLVERKLDKKEINRRVAEALELVGLSELAERRPNELSGGQQQRVALARTIVIRPKVLLLDEPLSNLDANLRVQMRRDILTLQQQLKLTTIFVTHDQEEANTTASRMAVLDQGVIQQIGSPLELYDRPQNRFVAEFLGHANIIDGKITRSDQGAVEFHGENGFHTQLNQAPEQRGQEQAGMLIFRPQNAHFVSDNTDARPDLLSGVVEYQEFLGSNRRFSVNVNGNTLLIESPHTSGDAHYQNGETAHFYLDMDNVLFLEK